MAKNRRVPALCAFMAPVAVLLCVYALIGVWPFGSATVLTGDLGGIYVPMMASLRDALQNGQGVLYSFSKSLGGEMLSGYAAYTDLLFMPVALLVPARYLAGTMMLNYLLKAGLTSLACYLFLAHRPGAGRWLPVCLAWCYALSAYHMAFMQNPMWLNTALLAPLVLLCVDRLHCRRWRLGYAGLLALALVVNFYTAYMLCLFCVLYFIYGQVAAWQKGQAKAVLRQAGWFALLSLLAGGLAACVWLPSAGAAGGAKGGLFSGLVFTLERNLSLLDLPQTLVSGHFSQSFMSGWAPFLYCGYLALFGALLFFVSRAQPLRAKLAAGGVLLVFLASFVFRLPNLVWHGFAAPVWFSFRYSFLCILFLVFLAGEALAQLREIPRWGIALAAAGLAGCVAFAWLLGRPGTLVVATSLVLVLCTGLLLWWLWRGVHPGKGRQAAGKRFGGARFAGPLLAAVVLLELGFNAYSTQSAFEWRPREDFIAYTDGTAALEEHMQPGARAEAQWMYTLNDPLQFGYWGLSFFNSVQDDETLDALRALGFIDAGSTQFSAGSGGNPAAGRMLSLRYRMAREGDAVPAAQYNEVYTNGEFTLYEDTEALPMAFVAKGDIAALTFGIDVVENQNSLWRAFTGVEEPLLQTVQPFELNLENLVFDGENGYKVEDPASPSAVVLTATMPQSGWLCVSLTLVDRVPVSLKMGGETLGSYEGGLMNCGWFEKGDEVQVTLGVGADEIRLADFMLYCESGDVFDAGMDALEGGLPWFYTQQEEQLTSFIDVLPSKIENGFMRVKVQAGEGETLFTSIPYAEGWRATINFEDAELIDIDGTLLAVPLQEGWNIVELTYTPPLLFTGMIISGVSALALLALLAFWALPQLRKRRRQTAAATNKEE